MTVETQTREKTRVFITGNCEGLTELPSGVTRSSSSWATRTRSVKEPAH
jgi:hypothetical protein